MRGRDGDGKGKNGRKKILKRGFKHTQKQEDKVWKGNQN